MKQTKKVICILLVFSVIAVLFTACGDRGEILAVYDNTPVYEEDVRDIINYYIATNATLDSTDEEKTEIAKQAVRTYVNYKLLELDLKDLVIRLMKKHWTQLSRRPSIIWMKLLKAAIRTGGPCIRCLKTF